MPRMLAPDRTCVYAEMDRTGTKYRADNRGYYAVDSARDAAKLKAAGWFQAGNTPATRRYWVCEPCSWNAWINSCPKCGSTDLTQVDG